MCVCGVCVCLCAYMCVSEGVLVCNSRSSPSFSSFSDEVFFFFHLFIYFF